MLGRLRIEGEPPWMKMNGLLVQLWMLVCMKYFILTSIPLSFYHNNNNNNNNNKRK